MSALLKYASFQNRFSVAVTPLSGENRRRNRDFGSVNTVITVLCEPWSVTRTTGDCFYFILIILSLLEKEKRKKATVFCPDLTETVETF